MYLCTGYNSYLTSNFYIRKYLFCNERLLFYKTSFYTCFKIQRFALSSTYVCITSIILTYRWYEFSTLSIGLRDDVYLKIFFMWTWPVNNVLKFNFKLANSSGHGFINAVISLHSTLWWELLSLPSRKLWHQRIL